MRNATLRQLRTFNEVARLHSFTAAAKALHLTQPAVSMQLRQLEQAAGLPLLEQTGRRVHLTEAGRAAQAAFQNDEQRGGGAGRQLRRETDPRRRAQAEGGLVGTSPIEVTVEPGAARLRIPKPDQA